jgi:hypothetical protein
MHDEGRFVFWLVGELSEVRFGSVALGRNFKVRQCLPLPSNMDRHYKTAVAFKQVCRNQMMFCHKSQVKHILSFLYIHCSILLQDRSFYFHLHFLVSICNIMVWKIHTICVCSSMHSMSEDLRWKANYLAKKQARVLVAKISYSNKHCNTWNKVSHFIILTWDEQALFLQSFQWLQHELL